MDDVVQFVEDTITTKKERSRPTFDDEEEKAQTLDKEDFSKEEEIVWDEEEYLKSYFQREKTVLETLYGEGWRTFVKYPELPRKKYYVEIKRRDSSEERKKQKELALKAKRRKGTSIFRKY